MRCEYCGKEVNNKICTCIDSLRANHFEIIECNSCHKNMMVPNNID